MSKNMNKLEDAHDSHCCIDPAHGCKYSSPDCPVAKGLRKQQSLCEQCGLETEGYYGTPEREEGQQKQYLDDLFHGRPARRIIELQFRQKHLGNLLNYPHTKEEYKALKDCYDETVAELTRRGDMHGINEKFTFFWGDEPFSQWSRIGFTIDGKKYNCAEQWMMACKARHFDDHETEKKIMAADHPKTQKALGREVKNFQKHEWARVAKDYVYQGNKAKFTQHPQARKQLLQTKGTTLVEASPTDKVWGIGLKDTHPDAKDRSKWPGTNWLGDILTKLRDEFQEQEEQRTKK